MSTTSHAIFSEATSNVARLTFHVTARDAGGSPLTNQEVTLTLEGDGSLQPRFDSKRLVRETNADGVAEVTWYRRSIFGRDVKATLSVTLDSASHLTIEPAEAPATVSLTWAPKAPYKPR